MSLGEPDACLSDPSDGGVDRDWTASDDIRERLSLEILEDDEGGAVFEGRHVEHAHHVLRLERGPDARLAKEPSGNARPRSATERELQCDARAQLLVPRFVHLPHPSCAQSADDAVLPEDQRARFEGRRGKRILRPDESVGAGAILIGLLSAHGGSFITSRTFAGTSRWGELAPGVPPHFTPGALTLAGGCAESADGAAPISVAPYVT